MKPSAEDAFTLLTDRITDTEFRALLRKLHAQALADARESTIRECADRGCTWCQERSRRG